ncbi:MAG: CDP-alcohol phosphatidyltransferase family protein [Chloroflexota bacterium]
MTYLTIDRIRAWGVHSYTALGGVIGMFALYAAAEGETRLAFLLLVFSMIIDATDGILARRYRVRDVLPDFDGAMVDNVIDMLTFVWIPVFIMWQEQLLPHVLWTIVPIIAGLYAYGQVKMKTPDNFFLGFPSYWNIIALYLYWLRPDGALAVSVLLVFAALTFIPTRYLYPSKNDVFWRITWGLGMVWFGLVLFMLITTDTYPLLVIASLYYPAYYLGMSFYIDLRLRRNEYFTATASDQGKTS